MDKSLSSHTVIYWQKILFLNKTPTQIINEIDTLSVIYLFTILKKRLIPKPWKKLTPPS